MRTLSITLSVALPMVAGCFKDTGSQDGSGSADGSSSGGDGDSDSGESGDGDGTAGTDATDDTAGTDATGGELGPQLIDSFPANGDNNAPLNQYAFLYFDRPVSFADATGKILASQDGADPVAVTTFPCEPPDVTCVAAVYPESFLVATEFGDKLPSDTPHQITVDKSFEDPDGNANTLDQFVDFRTFVYQLDFFDDSDAIDSELGGIAYDPGSESLFVIGIGPENSEGPVIRRIPIPGGNPQAATTVALPDTTNSGGPYAYGLSSYAGKLLVPLSYASRIEIYGMLGAPNSIVLEDTINSTTLPDPHATPDQVWSVATANASLFWSSGHFVGPGSPPGIPVRTGGVWSMFEDGDGMWGAEPVIATGSIGGAAHLVVGVEDKVFAFRIADKVKTAELTLDEEQWNRGLHVDSQGRLYHGTQDGLVVYDPADDFAVLAERGIDMERFAVREIDAGSADVYFVPYRDAALIGRVRVDFE